MLKAALDDLWKKRQDFSLNLYFNPVELSSYMNIYGRYNYSQLESIFENTDVLIVPSIWYETFGYTVLEALSYGVPVIVSDTVGAKDIIAEGCGVVIENIDAKKIETIIDDFNKEKLEQMNENIIQKQRIIGMQEVCKNITEQCYES